MRPAALGELEALLGGRGRFDARTPGIPWGTLLLFLLAGGFAYGAAMGLFGLRALQALHSGLKVPLLLVVSSLVCLPSFFVLNTLLGLRDDFAVALRGVVAAQATMAVALAAIAPLTLLLYASTDHYKLALAANGGVFLVAALAGQRSLSRHYRALIRRNPRHRLGRIAWLALYVFVAIQTAWVLRPFVGSPSLATTFFRRNAWSNAYEEVFSILAGLLGAR